LQGVRPIGIPQCSVPLTRSPPGKPRSKPVPPLDFRSGELWLFCRKRQTLRPRVHLPYRCPRRTPEIGAASRSTHLVAGCRCPLPLSCGRNSAQYRIEISTRIGRNSFDRQFALSELVNLRPNRLGGAIYEIHSRVNDRPVAGGIAKTKRK